MDPATIAMIAMSALSLIGSAIQPLVDDFKESSSKSIQEQSNRLSNLLYRAYQLNASAAERLTNRLMNISFIRRTPATQRAIKEVTHKAKVEQDNLRKEEARLHEIEVANDLAASSAQDGTLVTADIRQDQYFKKSEDLINETEKVLQKYNQNK